MMNQATISSSGTTDTLMPERLKRIPMTLPYRDNAHILHSKLVDLQNESALMPLRHLELRDVDCAISKPSDNELLATKSPIWVMAQVSMPLAYGICKWQSSPVTKCLSRMDSLCRESGRMFVRERRKELNAPLSQSE